MMGAAAAGAVAASVLKPFRAAAAPAPTPCTSNGDCVFGAPVCVNGFCAGCTTNAQCGPGNVCGPLGEVCTCVTGSPGGDCNTACCSGFCCPSRKTCVTPTTCGCAAGAAVCGNYCCLAGETCSDPQGGCCCPKGATPCGSACCAKGVACLDPTNGICGCQKGTTPCGSGASLTCCPAGTPCQPGCNPPSGNTVKGVCQVASDRTLKAHVIAVRWEHIPTH